MRQSRLIEHVEIIPLELSRVEVFLLAYCLLLEITGGMQVSQSLENELLHEPSRAIERGI